MVLARASFLCHSCNFKIDKLAKVTYMQTGAANSGHQEHISYCSIQVSNWTEFGLQGIAPIVFSIDQYNSANNGFHFVYRTYHVEASIFRCHICPELPLNVIRVHVNIMVHFGNRVKSDNLASSSNLQPKVAYEDFYKDVSIGRTIM